MEEKSTTARSQLALLARLDERTLSMQTDISSMRVELRTIQDGVVVKLQELEKRVEDKLGELEARLDEAYVKNESFSPVQKLVYGFVGVVVLAVMGALVSSVLTKQ
jgi:hypothetical protein